MSGPASDDEEAVSAEVLARLLAGENAEDILKDHPPDREELLQRSTAPLQSAGPIQTVAPSSRDTVGAKIEALLANASVTSVKLRGPFVVVTVAAGTDREPLLAWAKAELSALGVTLPVQISSAPPGPRRGT